MADETRYQQPAQARHHRRKYQAFTMADETRHEKAPDPQKVANTKPLRWLMKLVFRAGEPANATRRKYQAFTMADETLPFQTPDYSTCPTLFARTSPHSRAGHAEQHLTC